MTSVLRLDENGVVCRNKVPTARHQSRHPAKINPQGQTGLRLRTLERNLVERFFNAIKHYRGIATRYEKTVHNFLAGLHLVCALAWTTDPSFAFLIREARKNATQSC